MFTNEKITRDLERAKKSFENIISFTIGPFTLEDMIIDTTNVPYSVYSFKPESKYYFWNGKTAPIFNYNSGNSSIIGNTRILMKDTASWSVNKGATNDYPEGSTLEVRANSKGIVPYISGNLLFFTETDDSSFTGPGYVKIYDGQFGFDPTPYLVDGKSVKVVNNTYVVI